VERYIGLDVHSQSTAMVVVSESGKRVASHLLETSASSLINAIETVPGTRRLILEEGTQSAWLSEVLRPHVQEVVVTSPKPAADRTKNDMQDAFIRAEELRRNAVYKRIYKPGPMAMPVREALRLYTAFNNDIVRTKNRFKALLRGRGVTGLGEDVYDPEPELLRQLMKRVPSSVALSCEAMLEQIYLMEDLRMRASEVLLDEARRFPAFRHLLTVPGFGPQRAATFLAIVVTPERFRKSHHLWSYVGLGISTTVSSEFCRQGKQWRRQRAPMTRGLKEGHPLLKMIFKGAALTVARMPEHPLGRHYGKLLSKGMKENLARLTLARKLAAIALAVWKNQEDYDPTKHHFFQ
jgi:transposase